MFASTSFPRRIRYRRTSLAVSVLLHGVALLLLLMMRPDSSMPTPEPRLVLIDLPVIVPEVEPVERPKPKADDRPAKATGEAEGGGGGRLAKAMRPSLVPEPVSVDQPFPAILLPTALPVTLPATPEQGPIIVGTGGSGAGTGTGDDVGSGTGAGDGNGSGRGRGDGEGSGGGSPDGPAQFADWIVKPTDAQMQDVNPWSARIAHVSGSILLSCRVDKSRRARDCRIIKETPLNYGFGEAAIAVVRKGRIRPPFVIKFDPNARVFVPVAFDNPKP